MAGHLTRLLIVRLLLRSQSQLQLSRVVLQVSQKCTSLILFASQSRSLCKTVNTSSHTSNLYEHQLKQEPILCSIIKTLKEILNLTNTEIQRILMVNPQLKKRSKTEILNNYYNLLENGIEKSTIMKNVWLLAHQSIKLKEKLDCIGKLEMNNDQLIPWLCLTQNELSNYIIYIQTDTNSYTCNKLEYLARRLECSIQELCELTVRCSFILKIPVVYIDKKLDILEEYNVNKKHILKDLWVFRYTENHIRQRCELYKDTKNLEIKTWAIRCPVKVISRAVYKTRAQNSLMQHHESVKEYLMDKLNIDEEAFNLAMAKSPNILRINLVKLNALINMLHQNGISSNEILKNERILYFNATTIQNRINILNKVGLAPRFPFLIYTEKFFERYVNNYRLEQNILRNQSVKDYLMNKLNTDEVTFEKTLKRWPTILRVRVTKLDELLNVLQQNGVTNGDILSNGRIFYSKIQTLCKRIETLKNIGVPPKVSVLTYSQKIFDTYVKLYKLKNHKYRN